MSSRILSPGELATAAALREAATAIREAREALEHACDVLKVKPDSERPELELVRTEDDDA